MNKIIGSEDLRRDGIENVAQTCKSFSSPCQFVQLLKTGGTSQELKLVSKLGKTIQIRASVCTFYAKLEKLSFHVAHLPRTGRNVKK